MALTRLRTAGYEDLELIRVISFEVLGDLLQSPPGPWELIKTISNWKIRSLDLVVMTFSIFHQLGGASIPLSLGARVAPWLHFRGIANLPFTMTLLQAIILRFMTQTSFIQVRPQWSRKLITAIRT